jgi:hypothetical protein
MNFSQFSTNIPVRYHPARMDKSSAKNNRCILWNILDTFIYGIIPFLITLLCSLIIIIQVCRRRRSAVILGGIYHQRHAIFSPQDQLSTLLICLNLLFLVMTGPFNICLIIESLVDYFSTTSLTSVALYLRLNESLRLLQNAYHAFSFVFYCVAGNKFRSSAKLIYQRVRREFIQRLMANSYAQLSINSCCFDRRRSSSSGQTTTSRSRLSSNDTNRRHVMEQSTRSSVPLSVLKRTTHMTREFYSKSWTARPAVL